MKERSILMATESVLGILEDRKTQTRRVLKPQPDLGLDPFDSYSHIEVGQYHPTMIDKDGEEYPGDEIFGAYTDDGEWGWKCPYGQVGDRLWMRETWAVMAMSESTIDIWYKASDIKDHLTLPNSSERAKYYTEVGSWRPSIHMPRWASRITLEITEIRVERLQEITEEDAKAEGCVKQIKDGLIFDSAIHEYSWLWDSLNAKYPWESNPWVWVISFKGVT